MWLLMVELISVGLEGIVGRAVVRGMVEVDGGEAVAVVVVVGGEGR